MIDEIDHAESSGNVFIDLGFDEAEAAALTVKSDLVIEIAKVIDELGLTQAQAASRIGIDQPTLSKALRGKTKKISQERLTKWLAALGCDITITISRSRGLAGAVRVEHAAA